MDRSVGSRYATQMGRVTTLARTPVKGRRKSRASSSASQPLFSGKHLIALFCLLLAGGTIALYSPVIGNPFVVLDDHDYVTANPHVQRGLAWSTIKWAFRSTEAANWHPLSWLSHALDCQLFGLNPAGHHLDSVLIHAVNAVLLFLLLQWLTRRPGPSLLVAALFAFHPINVESVAWIAERKNVLSTFFFFLTIAAYGWYAQKPQWRRYLLVAVLFALGLMAKPMVITLPFVLLLLDYWPLGRMAGSVLLSADVAKVSLSKRPLPKLMLEKVPLLALSVASAIITLKAQRSGYAVRTLYQFSVSSRVENAVVAYALYLWKMVWPARLAIGYPYPATGLPAWQWLLSSLVLICITVLVMIFRSKGYLPVGWFWFLGTLVPVIGLVQVGDAAMADRYGYIPLIGIFLMIAFGLVDLASARRARPVWQVAAAAIVLVALGVVAIRQMSYWNSEYHLWSHALEVTGNPFAHDALGVALTEPDVAMSRRDLEYFDTDEKRIQEARRHFEQALVLRRPLAEKNPSTYLPDMSVTLNNLGNLARTENKTEEARHYYEEGLKIHASLAEQNRDAYPADRAMALMNLGYLERSQQENDKALVDFGNSLAAYRDLAQKNPDEYLPNVAEALNALAVTERDQKQLAEAGRDYNEALRIRRQLVIENQSEFLPYLAMTLNDLGVFDSAENQNHEAEQHYEEALTLYRELAQQDPATYTRYLAATLNNLAFLYGNENRIAESQSDYNESLVLYRKLFQSEPGQYSGDVARVEAGLKQLDKRVSSK